MTSRQRMLTAIERGVPDRLPVTTHHVLPYFLDKYMGGMSTQEFFDHFGLDPILWITPVVPDPAQGQYYGPWQVEPEACAGGWQKVRRIWTDQWRVECEEVPGQKYPTARYRFVTPKGTLSMVLQADEHTRWITERLIKERADVDILDEFLPAPKCDVDAVNRAADEFGERGIVRGIVWGFDVYGQAGCWQDAACLVGIEKLILATYDDPQWVHELLEILFQRKRAFTQSLEGARFDILEHGGGDGSSTVISPKIFDEFVASYDSELIALAHSVGQRIVYHTCGGMMPILESIAAMKPDAIETFTPPGMGGDTDLAEAKGRIGDRVCMIGGFDQFHHLIGCSPEETRAYAHIYHFFLFYPGVFLYHIRQR